MAGHTFYGKQRLCYTEVLDFTDYQGIGRDPMYKRYDSVFSVVKRSVPSELQHFLATPEYQDDDDRICWYIDSWDETPIRLSEKVGGDYLLYKGILQDTVKAYKSAALDLSGEDLQILASAIKYVDDERVYCTNGKVYLVAWGMTPDTKKYNAVGSVIHEYDQIKKFKITFNAGEHGTLANSLDKSINRVEGSVLSDDDMPPVVPNDGWSFVGWQPSPNGQIVNSSIEFKAQYREINDTIMPPVPPVVESDESDDDEDRNFTCRFDVGEHGTLNGASTITKTANSRIGGGEIPSVTPDKGYSFKGWNVSPYNALVDEDKVFIAQYDKKTPWYKRPWLWLAGLFVGSSWLKWILRLLLLLLLVLLLFWLFRGCKGCTNHHEIANGVKDVDTKELSDGRVIEDNGFSHPITGEDGVLPDDSYIVAPIYGEDEEELPIIEQPGVPNVIGNRLFLFMEDENDDIDALAKDFKNNYPDNRYSIIGFDREVKLLVIQIPESERDEIRRTINSRIPNHRFIVFDEEIYELNGHASSAPTNPGWHLKAIHLQEGWVITKGAPSVKIAIVDDGIEAAHPMFKGRIVDAYNVFTQNNKLSMGEGHGTHTAGLAAGCADYYGKGAAGVAPNCKLMPIQVFDNKYCPLSALVSGVMYAVHHDADVVNISIAPSFNGLNQLPVETQDQIANQQFKNVELLWKRVCSIAESKNCILVFAAGNDDILSSIPPENRNVSSIVVTAVDKNRYPTEFTNYGPCSDISAPGKDIFSSYPRGDFKSFDGTSMAAPIVSGTIALMKSLKKDLTVEQARNVLYNTGEDVYGYIPPMVLVDRALTAVQRGDFSPKRKRTPKPVPDNADNGSSADEIVPITQVPIVESPHQANETDYDAIRRKIAEYKQKIIELEKLLPQN